MNEEIREKIKVLLDQGHDSSSRDEILEFVGCNSTHMSELMFFFLNRDLHWRYNQRAAWPISKIAERYPELMAPYIEAMIEASLNARHDAVKRNTVRILQFIDIPEDLEGTVYDLCFMFLNEPSEPIAIRVFSMSVLASIAEKYPDMIPELRECILIHYDNSSSGYKSRANKILKSFSKLTD